MKRGFTIVEMLVVLGIIAALLGISVASYSRITKTAERAKAQELVLNVETALTTLFQQEGSWPQRLIKAYVSEKDGTLSKEVALVLAKGKYLSLTTNEKGTALDGIDQFGIVTPWATAAIKRAGDNANLGTKVGGTKYTVENHILHYAIDLDGDGIVEANVGGDGIKVRATAIVWCIGKSGGNEGDPWPYKEGRKRDDVYSWTLGQTQGID